MSVWKHFPRFWRQPKSNLTGWRTRWTLTCLDGPFVFTFLRRSLVRPFDWPSSLKSVFYFHSLFWTRFPVSWPARPWTAVTKSFAWSIASTALPLHSFPEKRKSCLSLTEPKHTLSFFFLPSLSLSQQHRTGSRMLKDHLTFTCRPFLRFRCKLEEERLFPFQGVLMWSLSLCTLFNVLSPLFLGFPWSET